MKLWLIEQSENNGYDTYDSAVVVAADEAAAQRIHPSQFYCFIEDKLHFNYADKKLQEFGDGTWVTNPKAVTTKLLGEADPSLEEGSVICASFNAG